MNGNIVGEPFDEFVQLQIAVRQLNQFGGFGTDLRTNDQLQYLNNRNAWVKLASSVWVLEGDTAVRNTQINSTGETILSSPNTLGGPNVGIGGVGSIVNNIINTQVINLKSSILRKIGIEDPEKYPGSKLAESAVLFNTLSSFDPISKSYSSPRAGISNNTNLWNNNFSYGIGGTNYGIQPPPGIISVQVDSINRGSIRKANVVLKAHNRFQFDIIELLYLRLGFTMMLEWGWDRYLGNNGNLQSIGNTIIEEEWFTTNGITQLQMLKKIQTIRNKYVGNYDGFFGKVSNFTWNFNPDGSYDISIDLITIGDVIESLKVNTAVKELFYPDKPFEEIKFSEDNRLFNTNIAKISTLNSVGYFLFKKIQELTNNFTYNTNDPSNNLRRSLIARDYAVFHTKNDTSYKSPQYYIRLGELFSQLESLVIPKIQNDGKTLESQIRFETTGCYISYFPNQIPLDPRVCLFKPSLNSYGDITGVTSPSYFDALPAQYLESINGRLCGSLMNMYINFEFIAGLLVTNGGADQQLSLYGFLQDLCNGINNALGGVNKLEPVIKDDNVITIIDQTLTIPKEDNIVNLEIYGYNQSAQTSNFVKDIKFVSKITPQLATTISIGATAAGSSTSEIDGTAFSKLNGGGELIDRFSREIFEPDGFKQLAQDSVETERETKYRERFSGFLLADRSFSSLIREAGESLASSIASLDAFSYNLLGSIGFWKKDFDYKTAAAQSTELAYNLDKDDTEERIVNEPLYPSIDKDPMFFPEYYAQITELEKADARNQTYKKEDINQLVSSNYAIYLLNAFGGTSNEIQVKFLGTQQNRIITGLGSNPYFTDSTSTTQQLQIPNTDARYLKFDDVFISQGKSAYQSYINNLNNVRYGEESTPSSTAGFIPLSFDLILDGISGIKIYNKLNINNNFLPTSYSGSLNFIITKVNHQISNNSWDTSLSTISMPKTEPYKYNPLPTQADNTSTNINVTGPQPDNGASFLILDGRNRRAIMTLDSLLSELDPVARPAFRKFFEILKEKYSGYKAIVNDVRRTWEESYNLKKANSKNAEPGRSQHNYGLAIDINIETPASTTKRTLLKKNKTPWIEEGIDKVAIDAGLRWGGNFIGYIDCVHFDFDYNIDTAYRQVTTQAKNLDSTIIPPFTGFTNKVLVKVKKIDKLIKEGKIKLQ